MTFFEGDTLIKQLNNSSYGVFHNTINNLNIPLDNYNLPSIILIGNESSGKSSLIKNILKCNIFPINRRTSTKMPIKLDLINSKEEKYLIIYNNTTFIKKNKEDILPHIENIMNNIGHDIIKETELNIKFYHPEVINLTFYDLPGIREYPEELREISIKLTNKYINTPNTLVICVIPASVTRLTSSQALGLVINANKCKECIIALTMIDLLHQDDYTELLYARLLKNNDELKNIPIHKIIGVINKNIDEDKWIDNNIVITDNIKNNMTLERLLIQLNNLYHNYIINNWKHYALNQIETDIQKLNMEYNNIGNIDFHFNDIYKIIINDIKFYNLKPLDIMIVKNYNYNVSNWTVCNSDTEKFIEIYSKLKKDIINNISNQINELFTNHSLKLYRFESLKLFLLSMISIIVNAEFININKWFNNKIESLKYDLISTNQFYEIYDLVDINVKRHIYTKIKYDDFHTVIKSVYNLNYNSETIMDESCEYVNKRKIIIKKREAFNKAKTVISEIEKHI